MSSVDAPLDLYIAAYDDAAAADADWDQVKQLAKDKVITVEALILVSRDADGKIHVKDNAHEAGIGAAVGAVGGAIVGLIFPPALLASAVVGAGIGAGAGVVVDQVTKHEIRSDVENTLPPGSSGIVAIFEERWVTEVEKALAKAEKAEHHHVHGKAQGDA
ncbi:MAG: DUF1269 domain-containing protein [Propionibacteriaceae bacterium]